MELFSEIDAGRPTLTDLRAIRDRLAAELPDLFIGNKGDHADLLIESIDLAMRGNHLGINDYGSHEFKNPKVFKQFVNICSRIKALESAEYQKAMEAR